MAFRLQSNTSLTFNPIGSQKEDVALKAGDVINFISVFNPHYLYVEASICGEKVRSFIPICTDDAFQ